MRCSSVALLITEAIRPIAMAEPLSLVASVIAVATLAETVVTKGYQYLKVVMDCPQDVRSLMAEVNVLCGVLDRLGKLLQASK